MNADAPTAAMPPSALTVLQTEPQGAGKAGEGGEGGAVPITNTEFIAAVFPVLPEGAFAAVCAKHGNPNLGGWPARRASQVADTRTAGHNHYVNCSSFYPGDDGSFHARKAQFAACHFLLLDDLGSKVSLDRLGGFELSWLVETSPGNHQGGIILADPLTDAPVAVRLLTAVIAAGFETTSVRSRGTGLHSFSRSSDGGTPSVAAGYRLVRSASCIGTWPRPGCRPR